MIGQSAIIAPSGDVATCPTPGDELITCRADVHAIRSYEETIVNAARHRRPGCCRKLVVRAGARPPA